MESKRGQWGTNFGFLMAAIGSAVGLGNIWGFPYKMGSNGGFAFLLMYLILAAFVGFVVMLGELALGRKSGLGAVGSFVKLSREIKWLGWLGVLSAFMVMCFYSVLGGYCIHYIVANFAELLGSSLGNGTEVFEKLITNQPLSIIWTALFLAMTCIIVMGGIKGGIEKFSAVAMPALFVMLIIVIIRSVTLPGAIEGLKFMFAPNFEPLKENFIGVFSTAGGQMFFSLSLGMGCMITYGSYLDKKEDLEKNAAIIVIADTLVALLAGVAVLPAAFALGGESAALSGPSLLFVTLQNVFGAMGAIGPIFGILFYLLVLIAAITSAISLIEVITTYFIDRAREKYRDKVPSRKKYSIIACLGILAVAVIVAADGLGKNGLPQPLGFVWLDFMDLWSEGIMMPLGAMFMCVFIGYEYTTDKLAEEITLHGNRFRTKRVFAWCCKVVVPIMMFFVLFGQLQSFGIIK